MQNRDNNIMFLKQNDKSGQYESCGNYNHLVFSQIAFHSHCFLRRVAFYSPLPTYRLAPILCLGEGGVGVGGRSTRSLS